MITRLSTVALAALLVLAPSYARAAETVASAAIAPSAASLEGVLGKMQSVDPGLQSYSARVEFSVGLHSFPFLRKTVHGSTYFKRPSKMEVVFDDLPSYAKRFQHVFVGLGTPADWLVKFDITLDPSDGDDAVLHLTPKKGNGRLLFVRVIVDAASSLPKVMEWHYRDGGVRMVQDFTQVDGHTVIGAQHAEMNFPGVHAWVQTHVSDYAINVPIEDQVFQKNK